MFYELALEVCHNQKKKPIEQLAQALFELPFVKGPFNKQTLEPTTLNTEDFDQAGYLVMGKREIPFSLFFISEAAAGGSNWLDIGSYAMVYEEIEGIGSYRAKEEKALKKLFLQIAKHLYTVYPFRLGLIGYEVSGMYSLQWLKEQVISEQEALNTTFILPKKEILKGENQQRVTLIGE